MPEINRQAFSPKQVQSFQEATARINIWQGAVRSGKTYASIFKLLDLIRHGHSGDIMIVGVSRESIQRNVITEMCELLDCDMPSSKTTDIRILGRRIYLVGAHDEGAVRRIQGSTLAFAYVDEATSIPQPFWRMLLSRLSLPGAQLLATCNPEGPSHWLKKEFIDNADKLGIKTWRFELDDNPVLGKDFKDSLKKEYAGQTMWYRRYILGEWAVAHGLVYDGFDDDNIYDDDNNYPNPIFWAAGIDYGTTNPTACVLAAITPNQWPQIRIENEWYYSSTVSGRALTDAEIAEGIMEFLQPNVRPIRAIYIDPSAASLKCEFQRRDMPVLDAKHDVIPGIRVTSKFIAQKNLLVHKRCRHFIDEVYSYAWDVDAANKGIDKPQKKNDHVQDSARYLCYSLFPMGDFGSPDEQLSYDNYRKLVYGNSNNILFPETAVGGYL